MFAYIIDYVSKTINLDEPVVQICFSILIFSIVTLFAFFNLMFFLVINYYLNEEIMGKLEIYLPKLKFKLVKIYKATSLVTIVIESGFGIFSLSFIIYLCCRIIFH